MKEKNKRKIKVEDRWLKLDNAALIYPSAQNNEWNAVFRISVKLKEKIVPSILQDSLDETLNRFPQFNMSLKRGIFWYYFQNRRTFPNVSKEILHPCQKIELGSYNHLFRVLYYDKKISFEAFHSLTDGTGACAFMECLITSYLMKCGNKLDLKKINYSPLDKANEEEIEDSFIRYADLKERSKHTGEKAFKLVGTKEDRGILNVVTGEIEVENLKEIAKRYDATITEFLAGLYFKSMLISQKDYNLKNKPFIISIPINLRKYFDSKTLRNFSNFINVKLENKYFESELSEIINIVKEQMKQINKDYLMKNINSNVHAQKNFFVRVLPLWIKNFALSFSYSKFGENLYTTNFSNLGNINISDEFIPFVDKFEFLIGSPKYNGVNFSVISFNGKAELTFTSSIKEKKIEREFFRLLSSLGGKITLSSNI